MSRQSESRKGLLGRLMNRPVQYVLDLCVLAAAFFFAYAIRFEFAIPPEILARCFRQLPVVVLLQFGTLSALGVYFFIWRYVGMAEIHAFTKAALVIHLRLRRSLLPI